MRGGGLVSFLTLSTVNVRVFSSSKRILEELEGLWPLLKEFEMENIENGFFLYSINKRKFLLAFKS